MSSPRATSSPMNRTWASPTIWRRRSSSRSEEHTSELQSQSNLVCRLLLEKKNKNNGPVYVNWTHRPRTPQVEQTATSVVNHEIVHNHHPTCFARVGYCTDLRVSRNV